MIPHLILLVAPAAASAQNLAFRTEEIGSGLGVGYAVVAADMNDDRRPDVVVVDTARVIWYENPTWQVHVLIEGQTKRDNVCIAPYDIDGDGKLDFALGADWRPFDTKTGGTVQWLSRPANGEGRWGVHAIAEEPMMHRMRWADLDGDGRAELVAASLMGRDTKGPEWDAHGVRILAFKIPADPRRDPWPMEVLNEDLHVTHNLWPADVDGDGRPQILVASFEGVNLLKRAADGRWSRRHIGTGDQESRPNRGASEVKLGRLAKGPYIATIEPWHGFQVVAYTPPETAATASAPSGGEARLWRRHVLDDQLKWGHAVWCADLDGDADEELVIGVRDELSGEARCGLRIYKAEDAAAGRWRKSAFDPGGVAIEDLAVADLDGDGRRDIVAVGRQTHNVRVYWNETKTK
ncbi:MAG: VCBS repeat-containing protein [Planctomycetia bacterium]|nr:VCBS repeat-containing protein [Planctomycetia bacterium]